MGDIPIVSLDKIYLLNDSKNVIFLDCTRLDKSKKLVSRNNVCDINNVDVQISNISKQLLDNKTNEIVLVDDVVFSGSVLKTIINKFKENNVDVIGIRCSVATIKSYKYFNEFLPLGIKCGYLLDDNVIDQICERDFYFGIVQSGISIIDDAQVYKSPYFKPFGNPVERASIPLNYEAFFSKGCIDRSIELWKEIERLSGKEFYIKDLPERIYNTNYNEGIVKTLKKGRNKI